MIYCYVLGYPKQYSTRRFYRTVQNIIILARYYYSLCSTCNKPQVVCNAWRRIHISYTLSNRQKSLLLLLLLLFYKPTTCDDNDNNNNNGVRSEARSERDRNDKIH